MKHHGVNITTPPPPPMDGRGTENKQEGLHSESLSCLEAPRSTMEWILQLHPLPYHPSLHRMLVHHSIAHQYVAILTQNWRPVHVCVLGWRQSKKIFFLSKKLKWWNSEGSNQTPPDTVSDVITTPPQTFFSLSRNFQQAPGCFLRKSVIY